MVLKFYNLREQPFGVTPDPRYLYLSPTHREALASLEYGISSGRGFLGIVAAPGMGKTTILFHLLQQLSKNARTVFMFQTHVTPRDFLRSLMADLGLDDCGGDLVQMQAKLNEMLLQEARTGRRVVVVVDEAQNLEDSVLEHLRMLSNFETTSEKLMQIVLAGQTQLADRLASPALVQLRQRISMMVRLAPFDRDETERYINHRLQIAGYAEELALFTRPALRLIAEASGGIPRNINNLCFNALSLGCVNKQRMIQGDTIVEVIRDFDLRTVKQNAPPVAETAVSSTTTRSSRIEVKNELPNKFRRLIPRFAIAALVLAAAVFGASAIHHKTNGGRTGWEQAAKFANTVASTEPTSTLPNAPKQEQPLNLPMPSGGSEHFDATSKASPAGADSPNLPDAVVPGKSIRVMQDQTLYSIAMSNLGAYNKENVREIQVLNPWLTDPNRIRAGRTIRIPEPKVKSEVTKAATSKSAAEAEKP